MDSDYIKKLAYSLGAEVCGIGSLDRFEAAPKGFHPLDIYPEAKSVISIGIHFSATLFEANTKAPYTLVKFKIDELLDNISIKLANTMEEQGYKAIPIPTDEPYEYWDEENNHGRGILSLKHAAEACGLGRIGKNTLLINEKYGNRLYLGAVLTNIELTSDALADNLCYDKCDICLKACPEAALDGITIDQKKCRQSCGSSTPGGGFIYSCFTCRKMCPFSKT